jgi:UDP-N-acetylglucosamine 2-epimerase
MKKVMHIVGARPQFIKLAPLIHHSQDLFDNYIIHTGQHYDKTMSDNFFEDLEIPDPDYNLGVGSSNHGQQTADMLVGIETILLKDKPDAVIVYGDTNSTLAGAMAAVKLNVFTAHVEACLRSFNRSMPEEINRICVDHISNMLFAPTPAAMHNAQIEGIEHKSYLVGDIMTDSLAFGLSKAEVHSDVLSEHNLVSNEYYLLTLHRPYTVDNSDILSHLLDNLNLLGLKIVFPVHPRTAKMIEHIDKKRLSNIAFIPPQSYLNFICLMNNAKAILTDSGGIQKEAYILQKLCVTLRTETEWTETVASGWNILVNPNADNLLSIISQFTTPQEYTPIFGTDVTKEIIRLLDSNI